MKIRQKVEREIVGRFVRDALAAGYRLSVSLERGWDLDDMLLGSTDESAIMNAAFAGDDCHIFLHSSNSPLLINGKLDPVGWIYCVMGNSGWDVISDYSTGEIMDVLIASADEVSEQYQ